MYEGDLVRASCVSTLMQKFDGRIGIVTNRRPRWAGDERDPEMLIEVTYPELGLKEMWSEYDLEVVSERR